MATEFLEFLQFPRYKGAKIRSTSKILNLYFKSNFDIL